MEFFVHIYPLFIKMYIVAIMSYPITEWAFYNGNPQQKQNKRNIFCFFQIRVRIAAKLTL
jgi:hypothetical protein